MRSAQVDAGMRRQQAQASALATEVRERRRVGQARHAQVDAALAALSVRLTALEGAVAALAGELAAHRADDKRHTGKVGGIL